MPAAECQRTRLACGGPRHLSAWTHETRNPRTAAIPSVSAFAPFAALLVLLCADAATAQQQQDPVPAAASAAADEERPLDAMLKAGDVIEFAAETLIYDEKANLVTAQGAVTVAREGYRLRADKVVWNRTTGQVVATGDVVAVDPNGNQAYGDEFEVNESLRDAVIENALLVLESGGRLAAQSASREGGVSTMRRAVYSPCAVENNCGPLTPLWRIKAVEVRHDPETRRISYRSAWLEIGGVPVLYLPRFSHPEGEGRKAPGFLTPDVRYDRVLGGTLITPYFIPFAPNSDLTISPYIYTAENPVLGVEYRQLFDNGPMRFGGLVTYAQRFGLTGEGSEVVGEGDAVRGYVYSNGRFQLDPAWRITYALRAASDDTFLRRYDVTQDDVLRNLVRAERFRGESYFVAEGWAFQGLRASDLAGQTPFALPLLEYRFTPDFRPLGGRIDVLANTLAISRTDGEDMQRALAQVRWSRTLTTVGGQRLGLTTQLRADAYHVSDSDDALFDVYSGTDGWHTRFIPVAAADLSWPLAAPGFGGIMTFTPRVQIVASPFVDNSDIPNEDSRSIELDDINIFDLNRFSGYDRWDGGSRLTYGGSWTLDRPRWRVAADLAQSVRLETDNQSGIPAGTGFDERLSDFVGRASIRYGRFVGLTYRFRLDQDDLAVRRNDIDLTIGDNRTYIQAAYTRLNRDSSIEDLRDREEVRAAARWHFRRYWSLYGAAIIDLTSRGEDPLSTRDGFQPIRHRIGVGYEDECFAFSVAWKRDYVSDRDDRAGNSYLFRIAFKNLGR